MNIRRLCVMLFMCPTIAVAGVNTKEGSLCFSYHDIDQKLAGSELNLTRNYSSKEKRKGWFGYGWSTPFEARLVLMPDGTATVYENGSAQIDRYYLGGKGHLQAGVEEIVKAVVGVEKPGSVTQDELRHALLQDEALRRSTVDTYGITTEWAVGTVASSRDCVAAKVVRTEEGFQRISCEDEKDVFDLRGRLITHESDEGRYTIHYQGDRPSMIEDGKGQRLLLTWTASGNLAQVWTGEEGIGTFYSYGYDDRGDLITASGAGDEHFRYTYDDRHNLTRIEYSDGRHREMQYNEDGRLTSLAGIDGTRTEYTYQPDATQPEQHDRVVTTWIAPDGERSTRETEFWRATDPDGVERVFRMVKTQGSVKQEAVWDERGRLKRVIKAGGEVEEFFYHPTLKKLAEVRNGSGIRRFKYDQQGNLIGAEDGTGRRIELKYGKDEHIIRMIETDKKAHIRRDLRFSYNEAGQPVMIQLRGKGKINVEYNAQGEIANVESDQGTAMALEITSAFQVLLDLVKVSGAEEACGWCD